YLRQNPLPIDDFIDPTSEQIIEDNTDLTEVLVERYSVTEEVESEEEGDEVTRITFAEARKALEMLQLYELQCPDGRKDIISKLDSIKSALSQRQQLGAKQQGILSFFKKVED